MGRRDGLGCPFSLFFPSQRKTYYNSITLIIRRIKAYFYVSGCQFPIIFLYFPMFWQLSYIFLFFIERPIITIIQSIHMFARYFICAITYARYGQSSYITCYIWVSLDFRLRRGFRQMARAADFRRG